MTYPDTQLLIDGQWRDALDGRTLPVTVPTGRSATGMVTVLSSGRRLTGVGPGAVTGASGSGSTSTV